MMKRTVGIVFSLSGAGSLCAPPQIMEFFDVPRQAVEAKA